MNLKKVPLFERGIYGEAVPTEGLEPPHPAASDPKSDVSTNFTTWAFRAAKVMDLF